MGVSTSFKLLLIVNCDWRRAVEFAYIRALHMNCNLQRPETTNARKHFSRCNLPLTPFTAEPDVSYANERRYVNCDF